MKTPLLCGHRFGKRAGRKRIYVCPRYVVFFGQVLRSLNHVDAGGRVLQRLPHEVFKTHRRAELKTRAVVKRGNRVAGHAFGANHQRHVGSATLNLLTRLAKQLKTRAANALHHDGGHVYGHACIQAGVARQHELVKVARRHVACNHRVNMLGWYTRFG